MKRGTMANAPGRDACERSLRTSLANHVCKWRLHLIFATTPNRPFTAMPRLSASPVQLSQADARRIWLRAQRLDVPAPFGAGTQATLAAVEHLGYVQIDTINVIERCHHHILWSRIPSYQRDHLRLAQSVEKSVFEYWTHALAYVPTRDMRYFIADMKGQRTEPMKWFSAVTPADLRKVIKRIREGGPLSIRDIEDDVLVDKDHPWASRKPSKRALQLAFMMGKLAVSERSGMLKTYELMDRHFGWESLPKAATVRQTLEYRLDRSLLSQGLVSLDSICHLEPSRKPDVRAIIEARVKRGTLVPVVIAGVSKIEHWATAEVLDEFVSGGESQVGSSATNSGNSTSVVHGGVHILSPFDPLIIQRKRLKLFFDYEHRFEAYVPKPKRVYGYFGLPVLVDDEIVAVLDLKADRERSELLIQQWTWLSAKPRSAAARHKARIEEKLHEFERFQFGD